MMPQLGINRLFENKQSLQGSSCNKYKPNNRGQTVWSTKGQVMFMSIKLSVNL